MGANMTVPYGAWMGSRIEDSFYPPHDLATEMQAFLAEHEDLFSRQTCNEVAVVFSIESNRELISRQDSADNVTNRPGRVRRGALPGRHRRVGGRAGAVRRRDVR